MDAQEIIDFMNANQVCYLATCENGKPRVRGMMMYKADSSGILFHTGHAKDLCIQVETNPDVEICFFNAESNIQIRVRGKAAVSDDMELKKQAVKDRPFMKPWVDERGYGILAMIKVSGCKACVWTFENNLKPKEWIDL